MDPAPPDDQHLRAHLKRELRKRRQGVRRAMSADARRRRSAPLLERVRSLREWGEARTLLAFVPMPTEVQLQPLVEEAWADARSVAAPRMAQDLADLEVRAWTADTALEESGMGFFQPPPDAPEAPLATIDLVLVPALAVDDQGFRLGYGRGYYDRLLPRLPHAFRLAVVFDFELMAELPVLPWDEPVHAVVTDQRVLRFGSPEARGPSPSSRGPV
ncbi:MAG: 5-formyltetrahydrofolate cyclo-ligase [Sandaracinaceae bacterium]